MTARTGKHKFPAGRFQAVISFPAGFLPLIKCDTHIALLAGSVSGLSRNSALETNASLTISVLEMARPGAFLGDPRNLPLSYNGWTTPSSWAAAILHLAD
jgi:hypothetical protein